MILDAATLEIVREERKAKQTITDIKYGPLDCELIAVASTDGRVYIHGTKKYDLLRVLETPTRNCSITKVDFSKDGSLVRMCTNFDQLFFSTVQNGDFISNPTVVRDQTWLDPTCPFTWLAQGRLPTLHPHDILICVVTRVSNNAIAIFNRDVQEGHRRRGRVRCDRAPRWPPCRSQLSQWRGAHLPLPLPEPTG